VQDRPAWCAMALDEQVAQRQHVVNAPIRAITIAAVARRRPCVTVGDKMLANWRIADEDVWTFATVAVRKEHQRPVPVGRELDAVGAARVVTPLSAGAT